MDNPYKSAPDRAFWKRAVSVGVREPDLINKGPLIWQGEAVASAGSCFASNMVAYLEEAGFKYVRIPEYGTAFGVLAEDNFGYSKFSAAYGNIYTARQMAQLLQRALGRFHPVEDRWEIDKDLIIDPFRPGLRFPACSHREFDEITRQHLECTLEALQRADVFVFTLGLTEAWLSRTDGAVFPACPGTISGQFDSERHAFHNFSVEEVTRDLVDLVTLAREVNPKLRFILTVSPVPLVATATDSHVLVASSYSKAVLRAAAGAVCQTVRDVIYFPAYEIVTGPQAPKDFFEPDRRQPSSKAIRHVMSALIAACETGAQLSTETPKVPCPAANSLPAMPTDLASEHARTLSRILADAECEEVAAGL